MKNWVSTSPINVNTAESVIRGSGYVKTSIVALWLAFSARLLRSLAEDSQCSVSWGLELLLMRIGLAQPELTRVR